MRALAFPLPIVPDQYLARSHMHDSETHMCSPPSQRRSNNISPISVDATRTILEDAVKQLRSSLDRVFSRDNPPASIGQTSTRGKHAHLLPKLYRTSPGASTERLCAFQRCLGFFFVAPSMLYHRIILILILSCHSQRATWINIASEFPGTQIWCLVCE